MTATVKTKTKLNNNDQQFSQHAPLPILSEHQLGANDYVYILNDDMNLAALKKLHENFTAKGVTEMDTLYIVLNTSGGLPSIAFEMANYLRLIANRIIGFIPAGVFSSGVILAASFNELVMGGIRSHLTPIDIITDRAYTAGVGFNHDSTENLMACYDAVIEKACDALNTVTGIILEKSKLNIVDAILASKALTESAMRPILEKIDPQMLGSNYRARDLAAYYLYYVLVDIRGWDTTEAWDLAKHLSRGFPSHGFRIKSVQAKKLGLPVVEPTENDFIAMNQLAFMLDDMENFQEFSESHELHKVDQDNGVKPANTKSNRKRSA